MTDPDDKSFEVEGPNGRIRVLISTDVLRTLAGRSHVTSAELLDIYRTELQDAAVAKAGRKAGARQIRLDASDF